MIEKRLWQARVALIDALLYQPTKTRVRGRMFLEAVTASPRIAACGRTADLDEPRIDRRKKLFAIFEEDRPKVVRSRIGPIGSAS